MFPNRKPIRYAVVVIVVAILGIFAAVEVFDFGGNLRDITTAMSRKDRRFLVTFIIVIGLVTLVLWPELRERAQSLVGTESSESREVASLLKRERVRLSLASASAAWLLLELRPALVAGATQTQISEKTEQIGLLFPRPQEILDLYASHRAILHDGTIYRLTEPLGRQVVHQLLVEPPEEPRPETIEFEKSGVLGWEFEYPEGRTEQLNGQQWWIWRLRVVNLGLADLEDVRAQIVGIGDRHGYIQSADYLSKIVLPMRLLTSDGRRSVTLAPREEAVFSVAALPDDLVPYHLWTLDGAQMIETGERAHSAVWVSVFARNQHGQPRALGLQKT